MSPRSETNKNPSTIKKRAASLTIRMVFRFIRSMRTPAMGLTKKMGSNFAIITAAIAVPDPPIFRMSAKIAILFSQSPSSETICPYQRLRKESLVFSRAQ